MYDYELCPTCGCSLDIGEKCTICNPIITPIPIPITLSDGVISRSINDIYKKKEGNSNANCE